MRLFRGCGEPMEWGGGVLDAIQKSFYENSSNALFSLWFPYKLALTRSNACSNDVTARVTTRYYALLYALLLVLYGNHRVFNALLRVTVEMYKKNL